MATRPMPLGARPDKPAQEAPRPPRFYPKEHGAYAMLGLPLLAALVGGRPNLAAALLTVGAIAAFLAHEPFLVWRGRRGPRIKREHGDRARTAFALRSALAVATIGAGVALGGADVRVASVAIVAGGGAIGLISLLQKEKTALGSFCVAWGAALLALPVARACGWAVGDALAATAVWGVTSSLGMVTVRLLLPKRKKAAVGAADGVVAFIALFIAGALGTLATVGWVRLGAPLALLPPLLVCGVVAAMRPSPKHLRRVGWTLVSSQIGALLLLVLVARTV